jgi:hypothetical protein
LGVSGADRLVHGVLPAKGTAGDQKKSALNTAHIPWIDWFLDTFRKGRIFENDLK